MGELSSDMKDYASELEHLEKYQKVIQINNKTLSGKKSLFEIEPMFQRLQYLYYNEHKQFKEITHDELVCLYEEKIKEMDMIQMEHGMFES